MPSLMPEQVYVFRVAAMSVVGTGEYTAPVECKTKPAPPLPPVLVSKKLAPPLVGVSLKWSSKARGIEEFKLRYAYDVDRVTKKTLLSKLIYVEKAFLSTVTAFNATNLGMYLCSENKLCVWTLLPAWFAPK